MNSDFAKMQNAMDQEKSTIAKYEALQREYNSFRFEFHKRFLELVSSYRYKTQDIAQLINSSNALISKSLHVSYRINLENTSKISYSLFQMSIHEFLSEEKSYIKLPANLSYVVRLLRHLKSQERLELYTTIYKKWQQISVQRPPEAFRQVFKERYVELCEDEYTDYYGPLLGAPTLSVINNLTNLLDKSEDEEVFARGRIPFALFVAFMTDQPVDYYFVRDYTKYLPVAYQEAPGSSNYYAVNDSIIKNFISLLLNSTTEVQADLTAQIIVFCLQR